MSGGDHNELDDQTVAGLAALAQLFRDAAYEAEVARLQAEAKQVKQVILRIPLTRRVESRFTQKVVQLPMD